MSEAPDSKPPSEITRILDEIGRGDDNALHRLGPLVYDELRQLASRHLAREASGPTLQLTVVVHDAWLRLFGSGQATFRSRAHFFGAAAEAMRRLLIERARRHSSLKRGGDRERITFHDLNVESLDPDLDVLALHEAIERLEESEPDLARVVHLRYFGGLTVEETAELVERSPATVKRQWLYARARLYASLESA